eukprot:scaffold585759_cov25-Prasinocladus_malaysianus.AAC.1
MTGSPDDACKVKCTFGSQHVHWRVCARAARAAALRAGVCSAVLRLCPCAHLFATTDLPISM